LREPLGNAVKNDADTKVALAAAQALCGDGKEPALAVLGAQGLARVRKLVAGLPPKVTLDAARCLKR
jgi:hypothetical protein